MSLYVSLKIEQNLHCYGLLPLYLPFISLFLAEQRCAIAANKNMELALQNNPWERFQSKEN